MPTKTRAEWFMEGYELGFKQGQSGQASVERLARATMRDSKPKRKLSAWQKYIKNKRNHIKYRDGKLNLKKMGVAFRRSKRR